MERIVSLILAPLIKLWRKAKSLPSVRNVMYGIENADVFGSIEPHEYMLADKVRVDLYHDAITASVGPQDVVADLGTGSGILSLLAARAGAKKVYAIEQTRMIELASKVCEENGLHNVEFVRSHSRDFSPSGKVDIIIHEQIGNYLIDEDMIRNVGDLRDRVLAPNGRIIPARFDAYLEPFSFKRGREIPLIWEQQMHGISFHSLKSWLLKHPEIKTMQPRRLVREDVHCLLTEPSAAYSIDLESVPSDFAPGLVKMRKLITRDGQMDGFCQYFHAWLGTDSYIDTSPFTSDPHASRYHWHVEYFPTERTYLRAGDILHVEWLIPQCTSPSQWTVSWHVER